MSVPFAGGIAVTDRPYSNVVFVANISESTAATTTSYSDLFLISLYHRGTEGDDCSVKKC